MEKNQEPKILFVAMCQYYWGSGATIESAMKQMKKAACGDFKKSDPHVVFKNTRPGDSPKPWVDDYGQVCYHGTLERVVDKLRTGTRQPTTTEFGKG